MPGSRTNNHLEGWHSQLNRKVGSAHPNIFKFIEIIKKEQAKNEIKLLHINAGTTRVKNNTETKNRIKQTISDYKAGKSPLEEFLLRISRAHTLHTFTLAHYDDDTVDDDSVDNN